MKNISLGKCCKIIHSGYQNYNCSRPGKFIEDGKIYCGIHNPERARIRNEKYDLEMEIKDIKQKADRKVRMAKEKIIETTKDWFNSKPGCECTNNINNAVHSLLIAEKELDEARLL